MALKKLLVLGTDTMGQGDASLGKTLMKSFLYSLREVEQRPDRIVCFNAGAKLTAEGSEVLEDLRALEEEGVEIITCGTCANYFDLKDKVVVGSVGNMYQIADSMMQAESVVRI